MTEGHDHLGDALYAGMDYAVAPGVTVAALLGYMPQVAALLAVVWYIIRIIETDTVQSLFKKVRGKWLGKADFQE